MQNFLQKLKRFAALCFLSSSGMVYAQSSIEDFKSLFGKTPESSVVAPVNASVTVSFTNNWLGTVSSDWHNPNNWASGVVPNSTTADVNINSGLPNSPKLLTGTATVRNITMDVGSVLDLGNFSMEVKGNATLAGEIKSNRHPVYISGTTAPQVINSQGATIYRLFFANFLGTHVLGTLNITSGIYLGAGAVNNNNGDIILKSNATATAYVNNFNPQFIGSLTGAIKVERYLNGNGFRHIGSPVQGETIGTLNTSCFLIRSHSEAINSWIPFGAVCDFEEFDTYGGITVNAGSAPVTLTYNGFPLSGNIQFPLLRGSSSLGGPQRGWNSLYNPYAAPIDLSVAMNLSTNSMVTTGAVWIWNPSLNKWATRTLAGVTANGGNKIIALGQGFLVRRRNPAGGALFRLDKTCLVDSSTNHFIRSGEFNNNETIRFQLIGDNGSDETVVHLNAAATSEIDDFDAERPNSLGKSLELSTLASTGEKMMINAINAEGLKEMPLAISVPAAGSYKLILTENLSNQSVQILDLKTGRLTPAETGVTINASGEEEISSRFKLIFNSAKSDVASTFSAWAVNNHEIQIASLVENLASVEIFNSVGQKVDFTAQSKGEGQASIRLANPTDGILFVRSGSHTERVVMTR